MSSKFPVPSLDAGGTAPAINVSATLIHAPAANATPLPEVTPRSPTAPHRPVTAYDDKDVTTATLLMKDGTSYQGISFGAETSISGECVFQTGKFLCNTLLQREKKTDFDIILFY
jgi:carbamoyl-phosphate synthase/aspartate carbamoyltransferase